MCWTYMMMNQGQKVINPLQAAAGGFMTLGPAKTYKEAIF